MLKCKCNNARWWGGGGVEEEIVRDLHPHSLSLPHTSTHAHSLAYFTVNSLCRKIIALGNGHSVKVFVCLFICICVHVLFACVSEPLYIATLGYVYVCIFPIYLSNNMQLLHFPYAFSTYFEFNAKLNAPRTTLHPVFLAVSLCVCV